MTVEMMILQTICGAVMVLIGAVIARGWPEGGREKVRPTAYRAEQEDAYARDLAAMMEYGSEQEDEDEA